MANSIGANNSDNGSSLINSSYTGLPLSGAALALASVVITILSLCVGIGTIFFAYLCWLDPKKGYTAITFLLIPLGTYLIQHKTQIEKALENYKKPILPSS